MGYIKDGLTPEAASSICIDRSRAQCCRGPLLLSLSEEEKLTFDRKANDMNRPLRTIPFARSWIVKFEDHQGDCCPMLDMESMKCLIYDDRPIQCKEFPSRPIKGCEISCD